MPTINGMSKIETMLMKSEIKSISKFFISVDSEGIKEAHTKKLAGVMMKATRDEKAVNVTDNAT